MIPPEKSFAIFVAIDKYSKANKGLKPDLVAAGKDALSVRRVLVENCGFAAENVRILLDEEADKQHIEDVFVWLAQQLASDPRPARLWLQFSGHGLPAAAEDTYATMFATFDTIADQAERTALSWQRIVELVPKELAEVVVLLDICHAKNMRAFDARGLRSNGESSARRAVVTAALNGQFARELKDGSNSILARALVEALDGKIPLNDAGELHFDAIAKYLWTRVPELTNREWGLEGQQTSEVDGNLAGWVVAKPVLPWPRPASLPGVFVGFDTVDPPQATSDASLQCLLVTSSAEQSQAWRPLADILKEALKLCAASLKKSGCRVVDPAPICVDIVEILSSDEQLLRALRALCRVPIVIFDVTGFEPGVMLLLGFRSIVRRGITICSHGREYKLGEPLEFPFNFREVSFAAHSMAQDDPKPPQLLYERLLSGMHEITERPDHYLDLPGFDAVRRPLPSARAKNSGTTIFVLCPFKERYRKEHWPAVRSSLESSFHATFEQKPEIIRMTQTTSPRLVTQTLYEQIRQASPCVVDLSYWRPNVLLELGVRLAVSRGGADCIVDDTATEDAEHGRCPEQERLLVQRLQPLRYDRYGSTEELFRIAERHDEPPSLPTPWFDTVAHWIDTDVEISGFRPDQELRTAATAFESEEPERDGPRMLYPGELLQQKAAAMARERRIGAWLYLDGRFGVDRLARDAKNGKLELAKQYLDLSGLLLAQQEYLAIENPELLARVRERKAALEEAIQ